jgi:hypothetical protein
MILQLLALAKQSQMLFGAAEMIIDAPSRREYAVDRRSADNEKKSVLPVPELQ